MTCTHTHAHTHTTDTRASKHAYIHIHTTETIKINSFPYLSNRLTVEINMYSVTTHKYIVKMYSIKTYIKYNYMNIAMYINI